MENIIETMTANPVYLAIAVILALDHQTYIADRISFYPVCGLSPLYGERH